MDPLHPSLAALSPEELDGVKQYVEKWRIAGPELEKLRRQELRTLDAFKTIDLLRHSAEYTVPPRMPRATSGLVEQQRWFMKMSRRG
jgi:hypothetical protein